ncbi:hypothetical protein BIW11_05713 [Tropilaelaps mercedesae]|uniref:Uncharacterized protein n=1 Tax=Tropilaelaps mercedesae TaxID=418985 RepID=A0A1V9Y199_9ACAR|nr:hypothetical protein BIW11_05713 [Tropilaelaps mercedesae]
MRAFLHLLACAVVLHCVLSVPVETKNEDKSLVTGRASMLGRFEPIMSSVVVPFLVATGVVSLVRMVPGVVSSLPGMLGFAKRTGYEGVGGIGSEQVPKEFYDIMTMLDNAAIRYGQPGSADPSVAASQRQPVTSASQGYPYQAYQAYLAQQAQAQATQAAQVQAAAAAQVAQASQVQKTQATARQHQG